MVRKITKAVKIVAYAGSTAAGAIGGGGVGYALATSNLGFTAKILSIAGIGGVSITSAPVVAAAVAGGVFTAAVAWIAGEARGMERFSQASAEREGFEDGPQ